MEYEAVIGRETRVLSIAKSSVCILGRSCDRV